MDLGTIKKKMDNREYASHLDFATDMRLIFTNCYKYNQPELPVVAMAKRLQVCLQFNLFLEKKVVKL